MRQPRWRRDETVVMVTPVVTRNIFLHQSVSQSFSQPPTDWRLISLRVDNDLKMKELKIRFKNRVIILLRIVQPIITETNLLSFPAHEFQFGCTQFNDPGPQPARYYLYLRTRPDLQTILGKLQ